MSSPKKLGIPPDFPLVDGESLFERRIRLIIWKQRNGGQGTGSLRNKKRVTVASLQKQIDALTARVRALEAGKGGTSGGDGK